MWKKSVLNFVWRSQRRKAVVEGMSLTSIVAQLAQKGEIN